MGTGSIIAVAPAGDKAGRVGEVRLSACYDAG